MKNLLLLISLIISIKGFAQGTFSMVAVDSVTGEVGSTGASCVDYVQAGLEAGRIGDPIPGIGAINTQAATNLTNQANARTRMLAGDSPQEIIAWLVANDVAGNPTTRQYGVVDFNGGQTRSAAHTGDSCSDYKNHILGPNYSIQGNILLGQQILDSMEVRFLAAEGDLACRLMAALQGAKQIGADTRCAANGTSALYAYVKVAQPTDLIGNPSFILKVKTRQGFGIEPVDSLQIMFDKIKSCMDTTGISSVAPDAGILVYPNPTTGNVIINLGRAYRDVSITLRNLTGQVTSTRQFGDTQQISVDIDAPPGFYLLEIETLEGKLARLKVLKE